MVSGPHGPDGVIGLRRQFDPIDVGDREMDAGGAVGVGSRNGIGDRSGRDVVCVARREGVSCGPRSFDLAAAAAQAQAARQGQPPAEIGLQGVSDPMAIRPAALLDGQAPLDAGVLQPEQHLPGAPGVAVPVSGGLFEVYRWHGIDRLLSGLWPQPPLRPARRSAYRWPASHSVLPPGGGR